MLRVTALILTIVLLINTAWYYPVTHWQRSQIRREVKRNLKRAVPNDQLHLITARSAQDPVLQWTKDEKEFRYQGKMYDVVRSETSNGEIAYHCISDEEETRLFAQLDQQVQEQMDRQQDHGDGMPVKKLLKAFHSLVYELPAETAGSVYADALLHIPYYPVSLHRLPREILTPPPRI